MSIETVCLIFLLVMVIITFGTAFYLDRRRKAHGNLLLGKPTVAMRVIAIIIGLILSAFAVVMLLLGNMIFPVIGLLGIACILYGFGADDLLRAIENVGGSDKEPNFKE